MNKREKYSVISACVLLFVMAVYQFGISPFLEKRKLLERQLKAKKSALKEITLLKMEYEKILNNNQNLKSIYSYRDKKFTLFAFLEQLAVKAGVAGSIDYMKPSSARDKVKKIEVSKVEMKLKGIKMSQLMSYLYLVETSKNVMLVRRLSISIDGKHKGTISAVLHVETVKS